eukprot:scaffold105948_cov39-Tisochrysis_lutea.AAC.1
MLGRSKNAHTLHVPTSASEVKCTITAVIAQSGISASVEEFLYQLVSSSAGAPHQRRHTSSVSHINVRRSVDEFERMDKTMLAGKGERNGSMIAAYWPGVFARFGLKQEGVERRDGRRMLRCLCGGALSTMR